MDNSSISCLFTTKYFIYAAFLERYTISLIESRVSNTFISNDFPRSDSERFKLYRSFHFAIRSDPLVCKAIYSITGISRPPLIDGQMVNFQKKGLPKKIILLPFFFKRRCTFFILTIVFFPSKYDEVDVLKEECQTFQLTGR